MASTFKTGLEVRLAARSGAFAGVTGGLAPSYLQANLIILPQRYADDFRLLCARNPVPCPLLAESADPGSYDTLISHVRPSGNTQPLAVAADIDLRKDAPRYRVYKDGKSPVEDPVDVEALWRPDHVGFLMGCSYSFDETLVEAGLPPQYVELRRSNPIYRTSIPLCPAGVFTGSNYLVSMRPYRAADVERVRELTRPYVITHGEPIAWGWEALEQLGIQDITRPEWGEPPLRADGKTLLAKDDDELVPVFWGCGVTPQEAVMRANIPGTVIGHAPSYMMVLDLQDHEVFPSVAKQV
ncbi:DUF1445-domain-containing protein [Thozetella sp. PMI_491]|nr:DUF1445-domain-containing protein [Thozetella sp. PMI_491]